MEKGTVKDIITGKMVGMVLITIGCVGAVASYVEFRSASNSQIVKMESQYARQEMRQEMINLINSKYNNESGIRLELLVNQQSKTLENTVNNTQELIKLSERIGTNMALFNQELLNLKERVNSK